jgi:hypothetical protein
VRLLLAIAMLVLVACASEESDQVGPVVGGIHVDGSEQTLALDDPDLCGLLPACGACSLVCDLDQLAEQYVPEGTCALFVCTLTDGRQIHVDVCNLPD